MTNANNGTRARLRNASECVQMSSEACWLHPAWTDVNRSAISLYHKTRPDLFNAYVIFSCCLRLCLFFVCIHTYIHACIDTCMQTCIHTREMFYLTTHSTHFIYGYMASDIWLRTILIVRKETRCRHIGYSYRLTARVLLYAPSQDRITHTTAFVTPVVEHWLEREIA